MDATARSNDRRQQTDRRRESGRREADQPQTEHFGDSSHNREANVKSRPVVHALSENEIRFLLDDE